MEPNAKDRAAWTMASLIAAVFGWVERNRPIGDVGYELARAPGHGPKVADSPEAS
jgi:hypothetical protein